MKNIFRFQYFVWPKTQLTSATLTFPCNFRSQNRNVLFRNTTWIRSLKSFTAATLRSLNLFHKLPWVECTYFNTSHSFEMLKEHFNYHNITLFDGFNSVQVTLHVCVNSRSETLEPAPTPCKTYMWTFLKGIAPLMKNITLIKRLENNWTASFVHSIKDFQFEMHFKCMCGRVYICQPRMWKALTQCPPINSILFLPQFKSYFCFCCRLLFHHFKLFRKIMLLWRKIHKNNKKNILRKNHNNNNNKLCIQTMSSENLWKLAMLFSIPSKFSKKNSQCAIVTTPKKYAVQV